MPDGRADRLQPQPAVQRQPLDNAGNEQVRIAVIERMLVERPHQPEEDGAVAPAGLDREEADFERARAGARQQCSVREAIGHGERGLIVPAHHADELAIAENDEVGVLVMEFIDEQAGAGIGVLGDFRNERAVVQPVDLLELIIGVGAFKEVRSDAYHPSASGANAREGGRSDVGTPAQLPGGRGLRAKGLLKSY